ncbi:hypothetical protein [Streptomyces sp. NPDC048425]|uniref:hypothetical protein n=1 Tax=Streptomyces sp. NPDC048425 TaxID=3365548 RepID=UPI00371D8C1C
MLLVRWDYGIRHTLSGRPPTRAAALKKLILQLSRENTQWSDERPLQAGDRQRSARGPRPCPHHEPGHARQVLVAYERHYDEHRPTVPATDFRQAPNTTPSPCTEGTSRLRTHVLGGTINAYRYTA